MKLQKKQNSIAIHHASFLMSFTLLLITMAKSSLAQIDDDSGVPVLDTTGRPLERGVSYYISPAITDIAGDVFLTSRNTSTPCPLYVGLLPRGAGRRGFPVTFTPYVKGENIIREGRDFKAVSEALTTCVQSTAWRVGDSDEATGRRFIVTGNDDGPTGYFRIDKSELGLYNLGWCPSDVPIKGRPRCGSAGILEEDGVNLLTLDGSAFPFQFERA